jgi:hypothetical protein
MASLVGSVVVVVDGATVDVDVDVATGVVGGLPAARGLAPLHALTESVATATASIRRPPCIVRESDTDEGVAITDFYAATDSLDQPCP